MLVLEMKIQAKPTQYDAMDEAIRTAQFIRNKALRYWMDNKGVGKYQLSAYCKVLAAEFPFAHKLNSMARQSSADRAWAAISRFYQNCKHKTPGKKGFPKFKKHSRSVEYKTTGWKLSENRKQITFTDQNNIGRVKLKGTRDLNWYDIKQFKRVRIVRRADGYYGQFLVDADNRERVEPSYSEIGLDVGLNYFCTDDKGNQIENPRFYRRGEKALNRLNRSKSKKYVKSKKPQSKNYHQARKRYALKHLKISRQRKDHAVKLARCVITSNDVVAYEDLRIGKMVKNHNLAKSITDAGWYQFRVWLEYFGYKFGKVTVAVPPQYTSVNCSGCGAKVTKTLSTRTHKCKCGCVLDRDENAARNILSLGLSTVGHTGSKAWGDETSILADENLSG
ncbi:RNA-guided endonuclease TnpB family protein [Pleurocapsa sp. PCC 7319]|uniref:RNA-guided endonuclease InsQ/TnpB family protein n=1 Tax=Pleurocapsa sp. PCC 7319 TaxID=118161 RepID=UPI00034DC085|nr:RNA-guided endonuclease TnpB family protein [Pleurocapsa sp. PCC 7319]